MTVLQVADLSFGYGADRLFEDVTFSLALGERVALVAPNGAGKTTLLRIVASELAPDTGSVVLRRECRMGFYRQSHEIQNDGTLMEVLLSSFQEILDARQALADARAKAATGTKLDLQRLAHAEERYHLLQGDELERRVEVIAQSLGFSQAQMDQPVATLSGGERGRLRLGTVLAQRPGLLLLDEPTNHLDLQTIDWLEKYLIDCGSAVLIVSHDRAFLDNVCPRTLELGHKTFRIYPLKYSDYAVAREEDLERERAVVERQQSMIAKTEDFIRKNIAGQKTKQAQSRRKMLDKLDRMDRPEDIFDTAQKMSFRFAPAPRTGDIVLEARGLSANRSGRSLFANVDILVRRQARIAIVGPNGCGKTTLLRLLAGTGAPEDEGDVRRGTNLREGYFDQDLGSLDPDKSAVDEIRAIRADMNVDTTRQYLSRFRFWGDQPFQKVGGLSGGERTRLALAKLLLEPRNLIFLDEPTNHLDIPSSEILEDALSHFDGTLLFVSHDRRFLENISTQVLVFTDSGIESYTSGYRDYVRRAEGLPTDDDAAWEQSVDATETKPLARVESESDIDRNVRRAKFEADKAAARALQRKERRLAELEQLIAQAEDDLSNLRQQMHDTPTDAWEELAKRASEEQALARKVESLMDEWTCLGEEIGQELANTGGDSQG